MNYTLDCYGLNFDEERQRIISASKRKLDLDNDNFKREKEVRLRYLTLKYRFLRSSAKHKKDFFLKIVEKWDLKYFVALIYALNLNLLKVRAYQQAVEPDFIKDKALIDHDRATDSKTLEQTSAEDVEWMYTIEKFRHYGIVLKLIGICGNGLCRNIYSACYKMYLEKLKENGLQVSAQPSCSYLIPESPSEKEMYTTSQSKEVERLRKKWNDMISKYKNEVENMRRKLFHIKEEKKEKPDKKQTKKEQKYVNKKQSIKGKKNAKKSKSKQPKGKKKSHQTSMDWLQLFPIWIVKKIFNNLDEKTLITVKKVNPYWKYAADSVTKDRKAKAFIQATIDKMKEGIDPKLLEEAEDICFETKRTKSQSPAKRNIDRLMTRGATTSKIQIVPKSKGFRVSTQALTEELQELSNDFGYPWHSLMLFPRYVKDDLVLYKDNRCPLKDVNIHIDLEEDMRTYTDTVSYSLSEKLSDTFSFSGDIDQIDLEGW